jgi:hypothetical protein
MVKRVTDAQLAEMKQLGDIKMDPKAREIAQFGDLIEQLRQMVAGNAERTKADLARSQVQLEILGTLQKYIRSNGTKSQVSHETIDLEPLKEILLQIHESHEAVPYQFDIQRADNNGPMQRVIATPIHPTRH